MSSILIWFEDHRKEAARLLLTNLVPSKEHLTGNDLVRFLHFLHGVWESQGATFFVNPSTQSSLSQGRRCVVVAVSNGRDNFTQMSRPTYRDPSPHRSSLGEAAKPVGGWLAGQQPVDVTFPPHLASFCCRMTAPVPHACCLLHQLHLGNTQIKFFVKVSP